MATLTTYTWITNSGTADWNTASNWSLDGTNAGTAVPSQSGTSAVIGPVISGIADPTITINVAAGASIDLGGKNGSLFFEDTNATLNIGTGGSLLIGGTLTMTGGLITLNDASDVGKVTNMSLSGGTLQAQGTITARSGTLGQWSFSGGEIEATGSLDIGGSATNIATTLNSSNFVIDQGAHLTLDKSATLAGSGNISFGGNGLGTLAIANLTGDFTSNTFNSTLHNVTLGTSAANSSVIDLINAGTSASGSIINGNTIQIVDNSVTYNFVTDGSYTGDTVTAQSDGGTGIEFFLVCYAAGTRILTPGGAVAVEDIAVGDQVMTVVDGNRMPQPVKWVGQRQIDLTQHPRPELAAPIRIRQGALGENLPERDLLVSPPHCVFMDGKLIPAKLLVNDMTIVREREATFVSYYHIELEQHAVLIAEGIEAESYLDTGNRAFFANAGLAMVTHPEFHINAGLRCWEEDACAPLAVSPDAVMPDWNRIADRAEALGHSKPDHATTDDADLHLVADGRRLYPVSVEGRKHVFMVPAGRTGVRLVSRASVPGVLKPYVDDARRLGVAIRGLT